MRLNLFAPAPYNEDDERCGDWSREQLEAMNEQFSAALIRAFELGLENRASAAGQVKLPPSPGPRFVTALCENLLRSAAGGETVFVAR